jgi:DNA-binding NarL/FixJ family response regulator
MAGAGDWAVAERLAEEAEGLIEEGERAAWTRLAVRSARTERLMGLGELDACADEMRRLLADSEAIESPGHIADARVALAGLAILRGEVPALDEQLRPVVEAVVDERPKSLDLLEVPRWLVVVELLALHGLFDEAHAVAEAVRRLYDSPWADYALAIASVGDEAPAAAAERVLAACASLEAAGFHLEPGRMRMAAIRVLAARPDGRAAAATLARAAHERFAELGSAAWCRWLEARLRELGEPIPRHARAGGGLTRRELDVLELLAEGLTNRAIAERLVISEATAIRHVANIYAKLGAHRRTEAVHIATERGLLGAAAHGQSAAKDT